MRRTTLAISKVKVRGEVRFCVTAPRADGPGRERRFFETKEAAKDHLNKKKGEAITHGVRAFALSEQDRADYLWCTTALHPYGLTVRKAIESMLPQLAAQERNLKLADAIERLVEAKRKAGLSDRHIYTLENRLERFSDDHPERVLATFTHNEIEKWLLALPVGPQSANHYAAALHSLFGYGVKLGGCIANPCTKLEKRKVVRSAPAILSPIKYSDLLTATSHDAPMLAYVAIGGLAGLRPAEILRLDWHDIDFATGYITVNARHAKTSRRRLIPINDALRAWLTDVAKKSGAIVPLTETDFRNRWDAIRSKAGLLDGWEGNELRHSYATYRLAETADAARTALELGNSPSILREHYAELCTARVAATYFATRPENPANVTNIAAA